MLPTNLSSASLPIVMGAALTAFDPGNLALIFSNTITNGPLVITGTPSATGTVGIAYSFTPTVTGGTGTSRSFALSGSLSAGLLFSSSTGAITGTPTAAGTNANLKITVSEPGFVSSTLSLQTITIGS